MYLDQVLKDEKDYTQKLPTFMNAVVDLLYTNFFPCRHSNAYT